MEKEKWKGNKKKRRGGKREKRREIQRVKKIVRREREGRNERKG